MVYLFQFLFGAVVGSFLNVCIGRIPNEESIVTPPSRCPNCSTPIVFYDNIPLVSYVLLRAHCRSCAQPISPRYFLVELLMGLLALALYYRFGFGFEFVVGFIFVAALIVISFIDLDVRIVPDVISLPGIVVGLGCSVAAYFVMSQGHESALLPSPVSSFIGILAGGGFLLATAWIYEKVTGVEGMGGGDIKLLAMIGAFLGWPSVPVTLFIASVLGSVIGLICMAITGAGRRLALPFAPFLCSGAIVHLFFSSQIIQFYIPAS
ncbi:MAG TPA: A24 family peptidase [Terriglobales bacterium]|jgi:leader peptidase (prepilin peptidase)/N-methyltransferase|nr:A24 family peptidase [Terriglobales bacterium]